MSFRAEGIDIPDSEFENPDDPTIEEVRAAVDRARPRNDKGQFESPPESPFAEEPAEEQSTEVEAAEKTDDPSVAFATQADRDFQEDPHVERPSDDEA